MTLETLLFWLYGGVACASALAVVLSQNVVRMAFWLVMSLGSVAALFFLLEADFVGATQLLIYVGGTVVLLIFGVMLTATGPYQQIRTSPAEMFLGFGVGGLLLLVLASSVTGLDWQEQVAPRLGPAAERAMADHTVVDQSGNTGRPLGLAFLGLRPDHVDEDGRPTRPGYLLPFEIVSVHLLVVLIGAAYLARAKRRINPDDDTINPAP
jgi:NADH-quinone oxidoreductase subunit J